MLGFCYCSLAAGGGSAIADACVKVRHCLGANRSTGPVLFFESRTRIGSWVLATSAQLPSSL